MSPCSHWIIQQLQRRNSELPVCKCSSKQFVSIPSRQNREAQSRQGDPGGWCLKNNSGGDELMWTDKLIPRLIVCRSFDFPVGRQQSLSAGAPTRRGVAKPAGPRCRGVVTVTGRRTTKGAVLRFGQIHPTGGGIRCRWRRDVTLKKKKTMSECNMHHISSIRLDDVWYEQARGGEEDILGDS